ncbi:MAG: GC-type dockerin domain-anchored protein [Phycisphaerales bacterium JB052]
MRNRQLTLIVLLGACGMSAHAQTVYELPRNYFASDLSYDGSVATGNMVGPYEPFRWTIQDGAQLIGGATVPTIGVGAGTPDISYDGTRISATILDETGTLATMGVWTLGQGWDSVLESDNPNVVNVDSNLSSAWGLSGDGTTISGYFYSSAAGAFGRAHPCTWSGSTGLVPLEVDSGRNARVNALNYDATIGCGWEERPDGVWQPTVWRNGEKMRLSPNLAFTTCEAINASGDIVVGNGFLEFTQNRVATIWRWDGAEYIEQQLDLLPGTPAFQGWATATGVSDDGSIVVGTNFYSQSPGGSADGIVWTESTGLVKARDYLTAQGFEFEDSIDIIGVASVSPDGSTFIADYFDHRTSQIGCLILRLPSVCRADLNGDGELNFFDVSQFLSLYGDGDLRVDFDDDGTLNFFDISAFLGSFSQGCPS